MVKSPAVVGIIPARYGSTRFPGKPLAPLLGKTLIQCTYENALRCPTLDEVVVATDDKRIFDHVKSFGGNVVMTSVDCPTGSDRLAEVLKNNDRYQNTQIVVNVQGDEPCLDPTVIQKVVSALQNDPVAVMATAVVPLREEEATDPHSPKCVIDLNGYALYFSRSLIPGNRQGAYNNKIPYYKHVGIYVFKRDFLQTYAQLSSTPLQQIEDLEQLKALEHGYRIKVVVVEDVSLDVNVPDDIKKVEKSLCKQNTSS